MKGILFSTAKEASYFLENYRNGRFDGLEEGELTHDRDYLVAITGIGKIKATLRTERFLQQHKLERIIHAGTCAALNKELVSGTIVGIEQVFEGDRIELATPTYPRMPLSMPFKGVATGTLVTQDHFVDEEDERNYWQRIADVSDMEGYAIAYVAALHGTPLHIVKVVVGTVKGTDPAFKKTLQEAHHKIGDFLIKNVISRKTGA
jgi:nucleoside phosphorylase